MSQLDAYHRLESFVADQRPLLERTLEALTTLKMSDQSALEKMWQELNVLDTAFFDVLLELDAEVEEAGEDVWESSFDAEILNDFPWFAAFHDFYYELSDVIETLSDEGADATINQIMKSSTWAALNAPYDVIKSVDDYNDRKQYQYHLIQTLGVIEYLRERVVERLNLFGEDHEYRLMIIGLLGVLEVMSTPADFDRDF